jgi:hypothetical protein
MLVGLWRRLNTLHWRTLIKKRQKYDANEMALKRTELQRHIFMCLEIYSEIHAMDPDCNHIEGTINNEYHLKLYKEDRHDNPSH